MQWANKKTNGNEIYKVYVQNVEYKFSNSKLIQFLLLVVEKIEITYIFVIVEKIEIIMTKNMLKNFCSNEKGLTPETFATIVNFDN